MPTQRLSRLSAERQEAILAAAADEFAEHGYGAASVNRIIERAGSSKGGLYYYFESKADLLATVLNEAVARLLGSFDWPTPEELTAATYWDRLREVTRESMPVLETDTWYMRLMRSFHRLRQEPEVGAATAGIMDRARDLVMVFLQRGRDLGVVRTDLPLEMLVEMHMAADHAGDHWMLEHWNEFNEAEKAAFIDARVDLVRDMLDARHMGWER